MTEPMWILLAMVLTIGVVYLLFMAVRGVFDAQRGRVRKQPGDDDVSLLGTAPKPEPNSVLQHMDHDFEQLATETGWPITTGQIVILMLLLAVFFAAIPIILRQDYSMAIVGAILGIALPLVVLAIRRAQYRLQVQNQLPDAFFLMARSLRAGLNLEQSMQTVSTYGTQPLAGEFKRVVDQSELGLAVPTAVQGMARRLNQEDFNIFATAVNLHRTVGGNLALLLDRVATSARDRSQYRGYFRAATALARITGIAVAVAPLVLVIGYYFWQPDFIERFWASGLGIRMLITAIVLWVVGVIWMILLLRTDY